MKTPKPYTPHPTSLPGRVVEFFRESPDEELEKLDIVTKFDALAISISTQLERAIETGLIAVKSVQRVGRGPSSTNCYSAGPVLLAELAAKRAAALAAATPPALIPVAAPPAPAPVATPPELAPTAALDASITYEPLVAPITGATGGKWAKHLLALSCQPITDSGHPTQRWPRDLGSSIQKAVCSWNKYHPDMKLQARIRGEHTVVQRIA